MPFTATQIALVRASLPRIAMRPQQATMAFHSHLSRYAPALGLGFMAHSAGQAGPLVAVLTNLIAVIDTPNVARIQLSGFARQLRSAGMSPRGYMAVHAALMDVVVEHIGDAPEVEDAWAEVIGAILAMMLAVAHGPRSHVLPLAA